MKYTKFIIANYKGIEHSLEVSLEKNRLIPIIGVNECGKTTILQAIFSFDFYNDSLNKNIRQLDDIKNLYKTNPRTPVVGAEIEISKKDISSFLDSVKAKNATYAKHVTSYKRVYGKLATSVLVIERNLVTKKYDIKVSGWGNKDLNDAIAQEIIRHLPYILFFDDFRDSVDNEIEIDASGNAEGWLAIIERLFKATDKSFTVFDLPKKEERARKVMLSKVNTTLEQTLTREWKNFRLEDNNDALKIKLDYLKEGSEATGYRHYLKFDVIEKDPDGTEYFFYVRDRSKGFYWFFNFVMKLEFNPKVVNEGGDNVNAIYLLDEPGSYLHASAQTKLCKKLKQLSEKNTVIYCTHSHYLLDPESIPISSIRVAVKDASTFEISLKTIYEYQGEITDRRSAFQPIIDALQVKPFIFDVTGSKAVIVEGICDYYCFELFKSDREVILLPSVNADSIKYFISLMIAWRVDYRALWDADDEGNLHKGKSEGFFGGEEAKRFFTLPLKAGEKKKVLQNLFEGTDLSMIRAELGIPNNSSFEKTVIALYFSPREKQKDIFSKISQKTKDNFEQVYSMLSL